MARIASLFLSAVPRTAAQVPNAAAAAPRKGAKPARGNSEDSRATIAFHFDILDLVTDHQFKGQKNSFHVEYEDAGILEGARFDPNGHVVPSTTYPYFQSVRDTILDSVRNYADQDDFYEVFGLNLCRRVLRDFPQIQKITLRIETPAYGPVNVDRGETITVERALSRPGPCASSEKEGIARQESPGRSRP